MRIRNYYHRAKHRVVNAWRDWNDRRRGFCCWMPLNPSEGGYHFWRCGLQRDHEGAHRFVNSIYPGPDGRMAYVPTDDHPPRLDRYPTRTRAQRRSYDRWYEAGARKLGRKP